MKKILATVLALALVIAPMTSLAEIIMGSWRNDDVVQMEALFAKYAELNGDEILFQPTLSDNYNANLRLQLDAGTGPDLLYARSYETGRELYNAGFLVDLRDIVPDLTKNFTAASLEPWTADDGAIFAVPLAAVTHAFYYNVEIFEKNNIAIPTSWEELLDVCEKLKNAGITPIGNGTASEWDMLECLFLGMVPSWVGGAAERAQYEDKTLALNDANWVKLYEDFAKLTPYLDPNFTSIGYYDSQAMFATGKCAMYADGSWSIDTLAEAEVEWSQFAIPGPGGNTAMCVHPDCAISINKKTPNMDACVKFVNWIASVEGVQVAAQYLPNGFFPLIEGSIELPNEKANAFYRLNDGKDVKDARFIWPELMDLYNPMHAELVKLLKGETTPQQAGDAMVELWK